MIVVDASVAVKWLLPEALADDARTFLDIDEQLTAPSLIQVEVAGAVTRKVRAGELDARLARTALDTWFEGLSSGFPILVYDDVDLARAADLSLSLRHALPDCLYLAVAMRLGVPLLTADRRFEKLAMPIYPRILPL